MLRNYIRMALAEAAHLARVPNQLVPTPNIEDGNTGNEDQEQEGIDEFSGVGGGAITGYTAPLGASPDEMGRKKNRSPKKQK